MVQLSHPYMTTWKTIAITRWTFVSKVMSLLSNMLSRFVIAFLLKSKHLLISWLQSLSAVTGRKICHSFYFFSIYLGVMGPDAMILVFWMLSFKPAFSLASPLSPSLRGSLVHLHSPPLLWYHLHIWRCWYFSWQSWFQLVSLECCILRRS